MPHRCPFLLPGLLALTCLCACRTTSLSGKPTIDREAFAQRPPRTLAVLPTRDASGHPEVSPLMRKALFSALAPLPYQDCEFKTIDDFLSRQATRRGCAPDQLSQSVLVDSQLADCVVFSRIEHIGRLYLILYSHYRIDLNFAMIDTRTRRVLYRNRFTFYDRVGVPTYSIYGLLASSLASVWHLRPGQLEASLEDDAREIAAALPAPNRIELAANGTVRLSEAQLVVPGPTLRAGQRVVLNVRGTPDGRGSFAVGNVARDLPLTEAAAGRYTGIYEIRPGDNSPYAAVTLRLRAAGGRDQVEYALDDRPFAIDTRPPPRARVGRWRRDAWNAGVHLELEVNAPDAQREKEKPAQYLIYRKADGERQFSELGRVTGLSFHDATARSDRSYEYYVITLDPAGNPAPAWSVTRIPAKKK